MIGVQWSPWLPNTHPYHTSSVLSAKPCYCELFCICYIHFNPYYSGEIQPILCAITKPYPFRRVPL